MTGRRISVPLEWYPRLYYGTVKERKNWRPFGFENRAIAWDSLDEHISVEGLLDGASKQRESAINSTVAVVKGSKT